MIDLHTWPTPDGHAVHVMLEECRLPWAAHGVNTRASTQFEPEFLQISPDGTVPAMLDSDGPDGKPIALFKSGAILLYLAGKTGLFMPKSVRGKYDVLQWLMFPMGGAAPMPDPAQHLRTRTLEQPPEAIEPAIEAQRLYSVLEKHLAQTRHVAGGRYSIADMAIFPWLRHQASLQRGLSAFPNVSRWYDAIDARPAVRRALRVLAERTDRAEQTDHTDRTD